MGMDIVTFSDARANLKAVMDKVSQDKTPVIIHRRDAEDMVMISKAEWDALQETMHLLASPKNAERLLAAVARFKALDRKHLSEPGPPSSGKVAEETRTFTHDDAE
jgi:antitoxin YefM